MINFVSFDDGLSFIHVSQIKFFKMVGDGEHDPYTEFTLVDGGTRRTSRPIAQVADMLGSANIWY